MRVRRTYRSRRTVPWVARHVAWGAALIGSTALVACASTVAGHGAPDPLAAPAASGGADKASPQATAGGSATPTPTPSGRLTPVSFRTLRFGVPAGWQVARAGSSACLRRPGEAQGLCTVQIVDIAAAQAEHSAVRAPDPKSPQGWWIGAGPPLCASQQRVTVSASQSVGTSFVKMRNKTAAYGKWLVHCADPAQDFSPRLWWLPRTQVALLEYRSDSGPVDADVDRLISSVSVG